MPNTSLEIPSVANANELMHEHALTTHIGLYGHFNENRVLVKNEGRQKTGSFKFRGALSEIDHLHSQGYTEVVTTSAGNHAAGVALAAYIFNMTSHIFLPEGTPQSKINNIDLQGGTSVDITVVGKDYNAAELPAKDFANERQLPYIPAFDNEHIISGQGTVAYEAILQLAKDGRLPDRIFVPVGGGGLLAGTVRALNELRGIVDKLPHVVAVQFGTHNSMKRSVLAEELTRAEGVDARICEGSAVWQIGARCLREVIKYPAGIEFVTVQADDIGRELTSSEMLRWEDLPETTGAMAMAGSRVYAKSHSEIKGETWLVIGTGTNADPKRYERAVDAHTKITTKPA